MHSRQVAAALLAALALGLSACGDESDRSSDEQAGGGTQGEAQRDPKTALPEVAAFYNRGFQRFGAAFSTQAGTGDFDGVKEDIAAFRTVVFEVDKRVRAIRFASSSRPRVDRILDRNRTLVARLDSIAKTSTFEEAIPVYEQALEARTASLNAINELIERP